MEYYKINEFARAIGVSASTLREYGKRGVLVPHHRGVVNNYRYYSQEQVDNYLNGVSGKKLYPFYD